MKSVILVCAILLCVFSGRETKNANENTNSSKANDTTLNNSSSNDTSSTVSATTRPTDPTVPTTTTLSPVPTTTTTPKPTTTTTSTTQTSPTTTFPEPSSTVKPKGGSTRRFDAPSFIGGMVLALGILAILYVAFKFFKERTEQNYHTL